VTFTNEIKDNYGSQFAFVNFVDRIYSTLRFIQISSTDKTKYLDIRCSGSRVVLVFSSEDEGV